MYCVESNVISFLINNMPCLCFVSFKLLDLQRKSPAEEAFSAARALRLTTPRDLRKAKRILRCQIATSQLQLPLERKPNRLGAGMLVALKCSSAGPSLR